MYIDFALLAKDPESKEWRAMLAIASEIIDADIKAKNPDIASFRKKLPCKVKARDLQVGDTVNAGTSGPFSVAIVQRMRDGKVQFYRPYATCYDVQYSGPSVICYTGVEQWEVNTDDFEYLVYSREYLR